MQAGGSVGSGASASASFFFVRVAPASSPNHQASVAPQPSSGGGACGTQASWRKTFQSAVNRKIDILIVVDDTAVTTS